MEELNKSIDSLLEQLFGDEPVAKSMAQDIKPNTTADAAVGQTEKAEDDAKRGAGRPKQISEVPDTDEDGKREGQYDSSITEAKGEGEAKTPEQGQVKGPEHIAKSEDIFEISEEDWAEFQAFKKSKEIKKSEAPQADLRKAAIEGQRDLIKSVILEATSKLREENETLKKSISETSELVKAMANKPQKSKSVTNVAAVEKFQKSSPESVSKPEVLDVLEDLAKSGKVGMEAVIEFENTGYVYDSEVRGILERELKKKYSV